MTYVTIFVSVVSLIGGYLMGLSFAIKEIHAHPELNPLKTKISKLKVKIKAQIRGKKDNSDTVCKEKGIKERFTDKGEGYADIVCDITEQDEAEYVEDLRKRQNISYSYTGRK